MNDTMRTHLTQDPESAAVTPYMHAHQSESNLHHESLDLGLRGQGKKWSAGWVASVGLGGLLAASSQQAHAPLEK